ncbi:MAG: ABC transporter permease [Gemmatimonadota bacterium]
MLRYVGRRLLGTIPLVLGIATIIFFVVSLAPGDPTSLFFNRNIPPEVLDQIRRNFGLDEAIHVRYWKWLTAFLTGDFGYSYVHGRPVLGVIHDALPATLMLAGATLVLIFVFGIAAGVYQAVRQHRAADRVLSLVSLFFYSMPSFWLGLMLMLLLSLKAHEWGFPLALPPTGMTSVDYEFLGFWGRLGDRLAHMVLPVLTLTLVMAAGIARFTRGQMLEVIRQDYIRTARAKGLPERTVILKHGLRNSLLPVITLLGLYLPLLFSGSVFVEVIFSWPGMGRVMVDAILQRDYPVVMATSFIFALVVILGSLIADILYAAADPRVRYE